MIRGLQGDEVYWPDMPHRRKGESVEDFRVRDALRKRRERVKHDLTRGTDAMTVRVEDIKTPEVVEKLDHVTGTEPIVRIYKRLNTILQGSRTAAQTKELFFVAKAFQSMSSALKTLQAMATHDEVRSIVVLVDPHLPDEVRVKLQQLLDKIDGRAGIA